MGELCNNPSKEIKTMQENTRPVLIVNLSKRFGGADVRVLNIANALQERMPYAVLTLKDFPLHQRLINNNLVSLPLDLSRSDPRLLRSILQVIKRSGYKVVDAHNSQSQFWGIWAAKLANVPVKISTVHSSYRSENRGIKGWLYEKILKLNKRWGCHFIAVSESVYEYLIEIGINRNNISLIYNSIKLPERISEGRDLSIRESFGWGRDTFVVIVVGRLETVKGHRYLIDALSQVVKVRPQIRCLIVGEGRSRKDLEFKQNVWDLLNGSDAFCMPSLSEGLPYALLEAGASLLPLLVTKVGEMAKLLADGKNAILVPPGESGALAKGLIRLIDFPEESAKLANASLELVREKFSLESMVEKSIEVYNMNKKEVKRCQI